MSDTKKPAPPDWEKLEQKKWRANAKSVPQRLSQDDNGITKQISTYNWRFGHKVKAIKDKIKDDPMFAAHFAKDPKKQSMHEKIAEGYLRELIAVSGFVALPKSGNKAKYVTSDGEIRLGKDFTGSKPSKSLDFEWQSHGLTCYASHKYTREGGGSQDNQYREQKKLLINFLGCEDKDVVLFAICDGAYYDNKKMEELTSQTRTLSPCSFAVHIEEVSDKLDTLIKMKRKL